MAFQDARDPYTRGRVVIRGDDCQLADFFAVALAKRYPDLVIFDRLDETLHAVRREAALISSRGGRAVRLGLGVMMEAAVCHEPQAEVTVEFTRLGTSTSVTVLSRSEPCILVSVARTDHGVEVDGIRLADHVHLLIGS